MLNSILKPLLILLHLLVLLQRERKFEQALKTNRGFVIKKMRPDGACLFRAVGMLVIIVPICVTFCEEPNVLEIVSGLIRLLVPKS